MKTQILVLFILFAQIYEAAAQASWEDEIFDSELEEVASGFQFTDGPAWHKDGYLLFSDIEGDTIYKLTPDNDDQLEIWRQPSGKSNGLIFDQEWRLIAFEHFNRRVTQTEQDGSITVIANSYQGKRLNSPAEGVVRSDGTIFFTDPTYGIEDDGSNGVQELGFQGVYRVKPGEEPVLLTDDMDQPIGILLSPDEQTLYVGDSFPRSHIRRFTINDDDSLSGGEIINDSMFVPAGMRMDSDERIFISSWFGIFVMDPSGQTIEDKHDSRLQGYQDLNTASCCFGGSDLKTLYITSITKLYRVRVKVPGMTPIGARVSSGIPF